MLTHLHVYTLSLSLYCARAHTHRYIRALSPTRLFHALIRSREIFAPELYEICIRRIASEADSTFKSQYFLLLPRDVLKDLLMCDLVNISEVEVFKLLCRVLIIIIIRLLIYCAIYQ